MQEIHFMDLKCGNETIVSYSWDSSLNITLKIYNIVIMLLLIDFSVEFWVHYQKNVMRNNLIHLFFTQ